MFSNPKVTFTPPPLPLLSAYLSSPFTLCISHFLFSPLPLLSVNLKLQALWGACMMWASVKWWIFFPFIPPFPPCCVSYLLLACVAEGLDIFVHTSFSQQT